MKQGAKMVIGTLAGLAFCMAARAVTSDSPGNPYQSIVERNVFGLKPPAPPPDPEANKPPPSKILLQGITTFGGVKRVLFKMATPPKQGQKPTGEQSFILAEGQRDGDIEILEINAEAGTVKVNNSGTITDLDFEKNGIKAPAGPAPGPAPGPPGSVPPPGGNPALSPGGAPPFARPMRLPTPTGAAFSPAPGGNTATLAAGTASAPFSGSTGFRAQSQTQPARSPISTMTAEERFLMVEAYRARLKQTGELVPPIPPTPLTGELNPDAVHQAPQ
jgi:hypothetical protein